MVGKLAFYSRCYDERDLNINRHRPRTAKTINQEKQKTRSAEIESPKKISNDFFNASFWWFYTENKIRNQGFEDTNNVQFQINSCKLHAVQYLLRRSLWAHWPVGPHGNLTISQLYYHYLAYYQRRYFFSTRDDIYYVISKHKEFKYT